MDKDEELERSIINKAMGGYSDTAAKFALTYALLRLVEVLDNKFPNQDPERMPL